MFFLRFSCVFTVFSPSPSFVSSQTPVHIVLNLILL
jgi:hypothetical protein